MNKLTKETGKLPQEVKTKIYKTGQTRGADDDVIYQNRVNRNSTVLIPYDEYKLCEKSPYDSGVYENGFIVLIKPEVYFKEGTVIKLKKLDLKLGENLLVFYETRKQWVNYPPKAEWKVAKSRKNPLGGEYVARIPSTTSENKKKEILGYNTSKNKGAGIRVYEYANSDTINKCKIQLEYLFWSCYDIDKLLGNQSKEDKESYGKRKKFVLEEADRLKLTDKKLLIKNRIVDSNGHTICPLCLKKISALDFCKKLEQAEGRDVPDLTVTETSLFHIEELRTGKFNHRPYNLGWGHHFCNVVAKDSGIENTLKWMIEVLKNNKKI